MEHSEAVEATKTNDSVEQYAPNEQKADDANAESNTPVAPKVDLSDIEELVMLSFKPTSPAVKDKLYQFLLKYHLDAPELKYIFGQGTEPLNFSAALEELAKATLDENPDKDTQAAACYLLADGYQKAADFVATLKGLSLSVDDYIALAFPEATEEHKGFFESFYYWSKCDPETLREQARYHIGELSEKYSKIKLYGAYPDKDGKFSSFELGRIGKKAKSMGFSLEAASVGKSAAALNLEDLLGNSVTLDDHAGKVVILYFWSSGCGPCRKSMPYYRELSEQLKAEGKLFQMITLSVDDDQDKLSEFMDENPMPFVNCRIGKNNQILHKWGINAFPTGILIGKDGVVKAKGQLSKEFLNSVVRQIL